MRHAIVCRSCKSIIGVTDGRETVVRHRGRTIKTYGSISIQCEKCGEESFYSAEDLRRLCGYDAAVPTG